MKIKASHSGGVTLRRDGVVYHASFGKNGTAIVSKDVGEFLAKECPGITIIDEPKTKSEPEPMTTEGN